MSVVFAGTQGSSSSLVLEGRPASCAQRAAGTADRLGHHAAR
ncbi:hypothetical protein [Pseudonocardia sp. ICBG601]|nr:hypothetical protein [Pseudonocardia sp. ICBG601]